MYVPIICSHTPGTLSIHSQLICEKFFNACLEKEVRKGCCYHLIFFLTLPLPMDGEVCTCMFDQIHTHLSSHIHSFIQLVIEKEGIAAETHCSADQQKRTGLQRKRSWHPGKDQHYRQPSLLKSVVKLCLANQPNTV